MKSESLCNSILDHIVGNAAWTSPSPIDISFHTGPPGDNGANEASGAGDSNYERVEAGAASWNAANGKAMTNSAAITFPEGGDDQVISHLGAWSNGTFLRGGALAQSFVYAANIIPVFAPGSLTMTES